MTLLTVLPPLETPNLLLREMRVADAKELALFLTQTRYQRHITHRLKDEAEVAGFVARQVSAQGDERRRVYHLAAEEKLSGEVIGEGFLIRHVREAPEIGWGIHPAMWSMGLGTEIGRAMLAFAIEHLGAPSVWCKTMAGNQASARLARRIGFRETAVHADMAVGPGRTETVSIFSLTASEYYDLPY